MEEKQNIHILKYYGNNNFFAALCRKNMNTYYMLVARTKGLDIYTEQDVVDCTNGYGIHIAEIVKSYTARAEIKFKYDSQKTLFKLINIKDEDEFDHLVKVLECIL